MAELRETMRDLLDARQLVIEQRRVVARAIANLSNDPTDFADALIANHAIDAGCSRIVTFDKGAVKLGMVLLQ